MARTDSYVVDTHSLVWFIAADRRLSRRAHEILREADEGLHDVIVPTIVLVETLDIVEKHKANVNMDTILGWIRSSARFVVRPLDIAVFDEMLRMSGRIEMHDRIVAATARIYGSTVITKDPAFDGLVPTRW